jgi:hypothetical protein
MLWLARLLLRERARRTLAQYGWSGCGILAVMLVLLGWAAGAGASLLLREAGSVRLNTALDGCWLAWLGAGSLLGKDLTWHIRLDRLRHFPVGGFWRRYLLAFSLSFASLPLFVLLMAILAACAGSAEHILARGGTVLAAFTLLAASVRTASSILRTSLLRRAGLSRPMRWLGVSVSTIMAVAVVAAEFGPGPSHMLPGSLFGSALTGDGPSRQVTWLAGIVLVLSVSDCLLLNDVIASGVHGARSGGARGAAGSTILSGLSGWPGPLWRICLLGWLRTRNALLLLVWGGLYGSLYMHITKPDELFSYAAFSWMVLVFHAYLRGNLLGVDHRAAWAYYTLPVPVCRVLQAKNRTLSLLQALMVAAVLMPAALHPVQASTPADWVRLISCAWSNIVLGEIVGAVTSVRFPEPIERSFHFSGGMTAGALAIPFLQLLFLMVFMGAAVLVSRHSSAVAFWIFVAGVPVVLQIVSRVLLPSRMQETLLGSRARILARLAVFSS